jgi:hypothetical protein
MLRSCTGLSASTARSPWHADESEKMTQSPYETGDYLARNPDWHAADAPFKAQWIADILDRNEVSPQHIVEVGSGSGEILVRLANRYPNAQIKGYDISPQAYAIASPKATERLTFHHADFLSADAPAPDVLMAIDVFEHVEDYMAFLKEMRPLAPLKIFHIPLDLSVQAMLRGKSFLAARQQIGHLHYFFRDTALATLIDCGYDVIDWNYTHGAEVLPNRALRTRFLNVPRRIIRYIDEDFAVRLMGGSSMMVLAS